jgi:tRNA-dependent cyclodipeptide synthase
MNCGKAFAMDNSFKLRRAVYHPDGAEQRGMRGRAYLGISLNNRVTLSHQALVEVLTWMHHRFERFEILVGDHLHRHNLMTEDGIDEEQASSQAKAEAADVLARIQRARLEVGYPEMLCRSSWSFYTDPAFGQRVNRFEALHRGNAQFRELVDQTTDAFLLRKQAALLDSTYARKRSVAYQLEELAMFEVLAEEGLKINVYPGRQLPTMLALVEGRLHGVSSALEQVTLVELQKVPQSSKS